MTIRNYIAPRFEKPDLPMRLEFENHMLMAAAEASIGGFAENLWGFGVTTDLATETVDAHLFFGSEPTDQDRFEISEFKFSFGAATGGGIELRIHRTVMNRAAYRPVFGELRWVHLRRDPVVRMPDDVGFDELDY